MDRKYLFPALAISALVADANAGVKTEADPVLGADPAKTSTDISSNQLKNATPSMMATYMAGDDLFVLRLLESEQGSLMAQHGSHASHASHRSHQSGR